jgi:hypothetical protein
VLGTHVEDNMVDTPDNHISSHIWAEFGGARRLNFGEPAGCPFDVQTRPGV